ncbi:helix-hairpin-helix domain-containing protein [Psychrobacillus psychrodurans]|uniref:helix-hairpin-helix domain-containing protein n=1 Tax=Psychrobacillus psychrodurans TaxID=126157 RepID=UPI0008EF439A|nr:helix-hairpin-helix domain-containing protein [Psychrobacillus psychrodurans]MCK1996488.1 helix-hairpin-helix domain-containing protein [Psychrobacillus psychrodurans]MCZ8541523.1 helix-hairpin-helix domain-containing protein [Psychrobacillus psychrodurans]SFN03735.1 competence protein ComEA [Psychrobacillus psychrodurans]
MILIQQFVQKYKKKLLLPVVVIGIILFISIQSFLKSATPKADSIPTIPLKENFPEEEIIEYVETPLVFVEVKGAVMKPGVYELLEGDRVLNAIEMAGGYLESSNSKHINHAERVKDEMVIYVPEEGEEVEEVLLPTSSSQSSLVNINNADSTVLSTLPGIGAAKAEAIISHREQSGAFKEKQDLKKVTGIGQKTYEKLEPLISVK